MTFLLADLRYALRTLRNSPGFVCVALLSLALGIGANTAIFSLIDSILLKSLPVRNPKELHIVGILDQRGEKDSFSYPLYERVRDGNRVFSGVFAAASGVMVAEVIGPLSNARIENARVQLVTGEYFDVLGVNAFAGRLITPADNSSGSPNPVAVVSYRFWKQNLGQNYSVLGKNIKLNGRTLTIAGISAPEFFGDSVGEAPDFWTPAALQPLFDRGFSRLGRANHGWLRMMGRLRPGLNESQARAAMGVLLAQIKSGDDRVAKLMRNVVRFDLEPGDKGVSSLRVRFSQPLHIVMAIVALLLLIACANVGNLLLARSSVRQAEIAIRLAVGASRWRVARQMLTESILLASAGGVLGILFAYWGAHVVLKLVSGGPVPAAVDVKLDTRVLGFTIATCLATGLLFGLTPALLAYRQDVNLALNTKATGQNAPWLRIAFFRPLIVMQIATSLMLMTGAGLFVRTLTNLRSLDLGFKPQHVIQVRISPEVSGYKSERLPGLYLRLRERLSSAPGVLSIGMADEGFQAGSGFTCCLAVEGYHAEPTEDRRLQTMSVTQEYFETMGIPSLAGRGFLPQDLGDPRGPAKSTIVNEAFAQHYFGKLNAVGKRTAWSDPPDVKYTTEIIGVTKDAVWGDLRKKARPMMYFLSQGGDVIAVRTRGDPAAVIPTVRASIQAADQSLRISAIETIPYLREQALTQEKLIAKLASFFGALALLLAGIGVYGMMSYGVVCRRHEIGIRMALGAQQSNVVWMVLSEALLLVAIGSTIGISGALAIGRLVSSQLFGVQVADPLSIAAVSTVLIAVAGVAGYVPARRASHVDPMAALRHG